MLGNNFAIIPSPNGGMPSVGWCSLTPACRRVYRAWIQRLKLTYDEALANFAINFNLRQLLTTPLKLKYDEEVSKFVSNFNARRYTAVVAMAGSARGARASVGHVEPMKPVLKAPGSWN